MNIASIDIGSNTVLLLIASIENKILTPIINKYESPRLGKGLKIGGKIEDARITHLLEILSDYKKLADKYNCATIIVTATNAMRIASNSNEIRNKIKNELKLQVEIISGDREAELSYYGASSSMPDIYEKVVIDIGGGSTEIIYGNNSDILFKKSFQVGVVSLTEMFLKDYPHDNQSIKNANAHLQNIFTPIFSAIPKGIKIIAVAGTPTTLSCIKQNLKNYDERKVEGSIIDLKDLNGIYKNMLPLSPAQIKSNYGSVVNGREDVLFAGLLILQHLIKVINTDIINISSRGIRYGNIIYYLNQLN
jgi:exopolyphosphatase/guanosine-5'-triphosphate,3'-diphosphate pyrophosphatase